MRFAFIGTMMRSPERFSPMQPNDNRDPWNFRALLESTATPFAIRNYEARAAVFSQGDLCDCVMHIEKGRVWLAVTSLSGKSAICGLLDEGSFLGEEALAGRGERRQSATAMVPTEVLIVSKSDMARVLHAHPDLMDRFVSHLLARNTRLQTDLTDQILYCSEQRLAHTLLSLANCNLQRPCQCALPRLSQEIMAEMVGTTRSRINAFMGRFRQLGFIEDRDGVLHVNPARLRVVPDGHRRLSSRAS
jgi:CRP/FNR family cyclic AMP-dependent transcriptional regulator